MSAIHGGGRSSISPLLFKILDGGRSSVGGKRDDGKGQRSDLFFSGRMAFFIVAEEEV